MYVDRAGIAALATAAGTPVLTVATCAAAEAENRVTYLTARSTGPSGPTMRRLIAR